MDGVRQGSILGSLLLLIVINDLVEVIQYCQMRLFADDTCVYLSIDNRERACNLVNADLEAIHEWSMKWIMDFSVPKPKSLIISNKADRNENPPVEMIGTMIWVLS